MKNGSCLMAVVLLLLLPDKNACSQEIVFVENGQENIIVNPYAYVFKNKGAGIHEIDKIIAASDSAFVKNTHYQEVNYGFAQSSGWCKFTIKNRSTHTDWILKINQSWADTVQLYLRRQNGEVIRFPLTGHFQPIKDRAFYSLHFAHPVSIDKNEMVTCYLFTQRKFARHAAGISLQKKDYHTNYDTAFIIFISALAGICVLAGLIGIVLFCFLHERVYIYYSIYCLSFLFLISTDTGFLYSFIRHSGTHQKVINNLSIVSYFWLAGWHILFTVELLKIKKYRLGWVYWAGISSGLLCCSAALILLLPIPDPVRRHISHGSYYIVFFLGAYILYAMIIQLVRREVVVYFYMGGFLFTVFAASILVLADLQVVDAVNQNTDIFFIAPVVEILCMVIGLGINSSRHVNEKLNAQVRIITVQEDERKRIAQDLHDDVGNSLAALKNTVIQHRGPVLVEKEIDKIIQSIRNISHDLMPVDFKLYALGDILRQTVNKFKGHPQIAFEYNQTGIAVKLHPVTELVIYRMVNELIANSIKHSQATDMMIQLIYQEAGLIVMVEDNGTGMKNDTGTHKKGIGLENIRHRIAYIKAELTIESNHTGTLVIIEVSYEQEA